MIGLVRMGGGVMCAVCSDIPLWSVVMIGVCSGLDWPEISDSHISFPPKAYMYLSVVFNSTQKSLLHEILFLRDGRMMAKCVGHEFNESGQNMAVIGELVWGNHYHHHPSVWVEMRGIDGSLLDWARWSNHHNHHSHHHTHYSSQSPRYIRDPRDTSHRSCDIAVRKLTYGAEKQEKFGLTSTSEENSALIIILSIFVWLERFPWPLLVLYSISIMTTLTIS